MTFEVDPDDGVPILFRHVGEQTVAQDAGIVDQDVETAERLDRHSDHGLGIRPVGHVVAAHRGLAAGHLDLRHHRL